MKYRLLLFFYVLSLILITAWQQVFHLPLIIIPAHLIVAIAFHSFCLTSIAAISSLSPSRLIPAILIGAYSFFVSLFYLLIFGSKYCWGDVITIKMLGAYFKDFNSFLRSMPFVYKELVALITVLIATPLIIAMWQSKAIYSSLTELWSSITSKKKTVLILLLVIAAASPLILKAKRFIHQLDEPLIVMVSDHMRKVTNNQLYSRSRVTIGLSDNADRKQYASMHYPAGKKNVILIIVDALRADHLSAYGYNRKTSPFIDGLLKSGHAAKVNRCYSTCACTLCGIPSILLSRTWNDCTINGFSIIGLLKDCGYNTYALLSGDHSYFNMSKMYSNDCSYYDGRSSSKYYFNDDRVILEGLDRVRPYADTPSFFYFHVLSTHNLGLLQDKYEIYKPSKSDITMSNTEPVAMINDYDNKVVQADDMIRQIFEEMDRKGYLQNSIVVITSDHGQGLGEHDVSGHINWLYDPQTAIPLIIYDDSISLYHNLSLARHIDIAPTIVDRLGLPKPKPWMGISLLKSGVTTYSYHETGSIALGAGMTPKYMVVEYDTLPMKGSSLGIDGPGQNNQDIRIYKYIFTRGMKDEELYEVVSDPTESHNLCNEQKQILERLRANAKEKMSSTFEDGEKRQTKAF